MNNIIQQPFQPIGRMTVSRQLTFKSNMAANMLAFVTPSFKAMCHDDQYPAADRLQALAICGIKTSAIKRNRLRSEVPEIIPYIEKANHEPDLGSPIDMDHPVQPVVMKRNVHCFSSNSIIKAAIDKHGHLDRFLTDLTSFGTGVIDSDLSQILQLYGVSVKEYSTYMHYHIPNPNRVTANSHFIATMKAIHSSKG